jgi:hypothetical protein
MNSGVRKMFERIMKETNAKEKIVIYTYVQGF